MTELTLNLMQHRRITMWKPSIGDLLFYTGWLNRWVGIINGINGYTVSVITAGTPTELASYTQSELVKHTSEFDVGKLQRSNGLYSIFSIENGIGVWYV